MPDANKPLTRKMEEAIAALLAHPTVAAAAQAIGVNEATLHRWLAKRDFQRA